MTKIKALPDYTTLHESFLYDDISGVLRWNTRPLHHFPSSKAHKRWNTMFSGKIAGTLREDMYIKVLLSYRSLFVHRVIWKMVTGKDPVHFIDHIDGNKSHNAFSNLREASSSQNGTNCKMRSNNVSGFKGVHFRKDLKLKPFVASVKINGKNKYLGAFRTPEEAHQAFKTAADLIYGEFSNHG